VPHDLSFAAGYSDGYRTVALGLAPRKANPARTSYQAGYEHGRRDAAERNAEPFDGSRAGPGASGVPVLFKRSPSRVLAHGWKGGRRRG
jgi:hypothetical protein